MAFASTRHRQLALAFWNSAAADVVTPLPATKRAFAIWKPVHVSETFPFFLFTFLHIWTVAGMAG